MKNEVKEQEDTIIDKNRIPPKVKALGLWHQVVYILVAEEEGQSLCEILKNGIEHGLSLETENLKTVLEELKAFGVVRSTPVYDSERWYCLEVA